MAFGIDVTMFTDASHTVRGAGGWAVWAICDGGSFLEGGEFAGLIPDSNTAELFAVAYGLGCVHSHWPIDATKVIMVQCDNEHAIRCLMTLPNTMQRAHSGGWSVTPQSVLQTPMQRRILQTIQELQAGATLLLRHIKSHTNEHGSRSLIHSRCDALAKKHQRAAFRRHFDAAD